MSRNYDLVFNIGAKLQGTFAAATKAATTGLRALGGSAQATRSALGNVRAFTAYTEKIKALEGNLVTARSEFKRISEEIRKVESPTVELQSQFEKARQKSQRLSRQLESTKKGLDRLPDSAKLAALGVAGLAKEQDRLQRKMAMQERFAKIQAGGAAMYAGGARAVGAVKRGALVTGAAAAGPLAAAISWERQLAEFNKVADLSQDELDKTSRYVMDLATKTGVAREELIQALTTASQSGYAREDWEKFAELSYKMAIGFDTSGEAAAKMIASWRAGLSLSQDQAADLAEVVNSLSNTMAAKAEDIGEVIQRQGAVIKASGLGPELIAGLSASLLEGGASPEIAATAAKNFALAFAKGGSHSKSTKSALELLGYSNPDQLAQDMYTNGEAAMTGLLRAIGQVDEHRRAAVITQIFGSESIGAIASVTENVDKLSEAFKRANVETARGSLQKEVDTLGNTTSQNLKKAKESAKQLATELGSHLLPTVNSALGAAVKYAKAWSAWVKENPGTLKAIGYTVAAIAGLKLAIVTVGGTVTLWKGLVVAVKALAVAVKAVNALMRANPIGLVVTAVAAGVALIIANWEDVARVVKAVWGGISDFFGGVWDGIKSGFGAMIDWMVEKFTWVRDQMVMVWEYGKALINGDAYDPRWHAVRAAVEAGATRAQAEADYDAYKSQQAGRSESLALGNIGSSIRDRAPTQVAPVFNTTVNYTGTGDPADVQRSVEKAFKVPTDALGNFNPARLSFGN